MKEVMKKLMKRDLTIYMTALTLLAALAVPVQLAAQAVHHHYQIVEIGTFGGPQSFLFSGEYDLNPTELLNRSGSVAGDADTAAIDPFAPNYGWGDGYVAHTFQYQNGELTDIGALPGGGSSYSTWETGGGLLAGVSETGQLDPLFGMPQVHAVMWRKGNIVDLGTLPGGGYDSEAESVNNHGQVVGSALSTTPDANSMATATFWYFYVPYGYEERAFLWDKNSGMQDLGTLGTGNDARATLINQIGQVAGWSYTTTSVPGACAVDGLALSTGSFIWDQENRMRDMGNLGGTCTIVTGLSNGGAAIGFSTVTGDAYQRAFFWKNGTLSDLGGSLGGNNTGAVSQNEGGQAVGFAYLSGEQLFHAALWPRVGKLTDLGTLGKDVCSFASAINDATQIVGNSTYLEDCLKDFDHSRPFLWEKGSMANLNDLIPRGSALRIQFPLSINSQGEISANGVDASGNTHVALLIPCDEDHPGIAGCDYSLVDAAEATRESPEPALETQPGRDQNKSVRQLLRRRVGPLSRVPHSVPHPMTGAVDDPKTSISQNSDWSLEDEILFKDGGGLNSGSDSRAAASQNSCPAARCTHGTRSEKCGACSCPFPHHGIGFLGYDSVHHRDCTVCVCT
jgi:probable HAF family extracellular repeat protein